MPRRAAAPTAPPAAGFATHCVELLSPLGLARARRMFGGHGLYVDELFIGILADEELYLKVDALTVPRFEAAGGRPFTYSARGRTLRLSFHSPPAEALDSPALLMPWARLAIEAALRARAAAPARRTARKPGQAANFSPPDAAPAPRAARPRARPKPGG